MITKDGTYLPGNIVYSNINFPQYAECKALPKPKITLSASNGRAASLSKERMENIDIVVNFTPFTAPEYCSNASSFRNSSFCNGSSSGYGTDCETKSGCMSEEYCRSYSWQCQTYYETMTKYGYIDLCNIAEIMTAIVLLRKIRQSGWNWIRPNRSEPKPILTTAKQYALLL